MAKRATPTGDKKPNVSQDLLEEAECIILEFETAQMRLNAKKSAAERRLTNEGVNIAALKAVMKLKKLDEAELKTRIETEARYRAALLQIEWEADGQGSFAAAVSTPKEIKPSKRLVVARAHCDGYNSGKAGGEVGACPFPPGSEEFVAWRDGWQDGHDDRSLKKGATAEEGVKAAPRQRKKKGAAVAEPDAEGEGEAPRIH